MKQILLIGMAAILLLAACSNERQKLSPQANLDKKSAGIYYNQKDNQSSLKKAQELYEKVLKDNPDYFLALRRLGDINFYFAEIHTAEAKAHEEAKEANAYKESVHKELQFYRAAYLKYARAATVLDSLGNVKPLNDDEKTQLRDTSRRRDNMLDRIVNRGIKEYKDKDNAEAIQTFDMAIRLNPKNPKPLKAMVSIYQDEKNEAKVEEYLLKIYNLTPDDKDILNRLGSFYFLRDDFTQALTYFEKVKTLDPRNLDNQKLIVETYIGMKDYTKALQVLQDVMASEPNNVNLLITAGSIAAQLKDDAMEMDYKKRAADKEPSPTILSDLCYRLANLQKFDDLMIYAQKWYDADQTSKEAVNMCLLAAQQTKNKDMEIKYSAIMKRLEF